MTKLFLSTSFCPAGKSHMVNMSRIHCFKMTKFSLLNFLLIKKKKKSPALVIISQTCQSQGSAAERTEDSAGQRSAFVDSLSGCLMNILFLKLCLLVYFSQEHKMCFKFAQFKKSQNERTDLIYL